jgi:hypothetical protein
MKIKDLQIMIKEAMGDNSVLLSKPEILTEANYWRVKNKIENEMVPFVMISAFRGGSSKSENLRRQKDLENDVANDKFPWTKMPGSGYVEDPIDEEFEVDAEELAVDADFEPEETEPKEGVEVKENSIIIWDEQRLDKGPRDSEANLFELAKFLAKKYNQDTFIYGKRVTDDQGNAEMNIKIYDKGGNPETWAGPWSTLTQIDDDDVFWSAIGSKKAKLTELQDKFRQLPVRSRMDAMKKQHYLNTIKSALKHMNKD